MKVKLLGIIAGLIYKLYSKTLRYHVFVHPEVRQDWARKTAKPGEGFLYGMWHQDELALIPVCCTPNITVLVSKSDDGTIIAMALKVFGYRVVRGSSSRGAVGAMIAAIKELKNGNSFAITLDGPRGPAFEAKKGLEKLNQKTGRPIIPMRAFPRKAICFHKSWSKSRLPLPFSRVDVLFGESGHYTSEELTKILNSMKNPILE